jgi:hypothetical protein
MKSIRCPEVTLLTLLLSLCPLGAAELNQFDRTLCEIIDDAQTRGEKAFVDRRGKVIDVNTWEVSTLGSICRIHSGREKSLICEMSGTRELNNSFHDDLYFVEMFRKCVKNIEQFTLRSTRTDDADEDSRTNTFVLNNSSASISIRIILYYEPRETKYYTSVSISYAPL